MSVTRNVAGLLAALCVAAAAPAAAQHQHHEERGQAGQPKERAMGPMAGMHLPGPGALLERAGELSLTPEQVGQLTELDREVAALREEALALHERHHQALMQAIQAEMPDRDAVRTHFDAGHAAMGQAHWLSMDAGLRAVAILTPAQRTVVREWSCSGAPCGQGQGCQGKACREGRRDGGRSP